MIVSSSTAPVWRLLRLFPVRGELTRRPLGSGPLRSCHPPVIIDARAATEALYPGGIDVCSFLDDGFCAGSALAVRHFLSALVRGFRLIGFDVNLEKTEVILAFSSTQYFVLGDSQRWNGLGLDPHISSFLAHLYGRRSGVRICLAGAFVRLGPSWHPLACSQMHKAPSVCFALARVGPKVIYSCRTVLPDA